MDRYERAKELGIIVQDGLSGADTSDDDDRTGMDAISSIIMETTTAALSHAAQHHYRTIRIENEVIGNTFENTKLNGIEFSPEITVINNMKGSLHGNNNAFSETGNVYRQNGVADFSNALVVLCVVTYY